MSNNKLKPVETPITKHKPLTRNEIEKIANFVIREYDLTVGMLTEDDLYRICKDENVAVVRIPTLKLSGYYAWDTNDLQGYIFISPKISSMKLVEAGFTLLAHHFLPKETGTDANAAMERRDEQAKIFAAFLLDRVSTGRKTNPPSSVETVKPQALAA